MDGSQYLVTRQESTTTRGDTSAQTHSQTVTYNPQTDTQTMALAANKVTTAEQQQTGAGESSALVTVPRTIQVRFSVELVGGVLVC